MSLKSRDIQESRMVVRISISLKLWDNEDQCFDKDTIHFHLIAMENIH
jgi:hypothetical protein